MGVMNRGATDVNRTLLTKVLARKFDIKVPTPTEFKRILILDNRKFFLLEYKKFWFYSLVMSKLLEMIRGY
jgi:hypothetical protein